MGRSIVLLILLLTGLAIQAESIDPLHLSLRPGRYRQDIFLTIEVQAGYSLRYQFSQANDISRLLPVGSALALGAMEGETRDYQLVVQILKDDKELERRTLEYVIDKTIPFSPEPDIAPGTWFMPVKPHFSLVSSDNTDRIFTSWSASDGSTSQIKDESTVVLEGKPGSLLSYKVSAYAEDGVKHVGPTTTWTYTVDRRREREISEIPLYSPVEGRFQNPQFLYIDNQAFSQIRYTSDGSDPHAGTIYEGGVLLNQAGRVNLRVWGKTLAGKELERTLVFESGTERLPELESATMGQSKIVQIDRELFYYAAGERQPTSADESLQTPQIGRAHV